jgi:hypothetical protein
MFNSVEIICDKTVEFTQEGGGGEDGIGCVSEREHPASKRNFVAVGRRPLSKRHRDPC